jgi:hypothetical protein
MLQGATDSQDHSKKKQVSAFLANVLCNAFANCGDLYEILLLTLLVYSFLCEASFPELLKRVLS